MAGPNYNLYSKKELEEALETIDQEKYPERVKEINRLLSGGKKQFVPNTVKSALQKSKGWAEEYVTFPRLNWLDKTSAVISIWFIIIPFPYIPIMTILLVLPILGIIINGYDKPSISTLVTFKASGRNKYDLADFIDLPAYAILYRVLIDFEVDSFEHLWVTGFVFLALLIVIILTTHKLVMEERVPNKIFIYCLIFFHVGLYAYVGVVAVNCVYDFSQPKEFPTEIISKEKHRSSKSTTYYVNVRPWGHHREIESIQIDGWQYNDYEPGDSVVIDLREGLLYIPWYEVRKPK